MKKQKRFLFLLILFTLALAACNGGAENAVVNAANDNMANDNHAEQTDNMADEPIAENNTVNEADEPTAVVEEPVVEDPAPDGAFRINTTESEVRFKIWEVLLGADTLVVGVTSEVEGWIAVDFSDPASLAMSVIEVNLTGIATDNNNRNGQIRRNILATGSFPTATFEAVEYAGLPQSVAVGDTFEFQITGNLTIKDVTKPVTFDVSVTIASETRIEGFASLTIFQDEFGASVLRMPQQVASIEETTVLEINFVAEK